MYAFFLFWPESSLRGARCCRRRLAVYLPLLVVVVDVAVVAQFKLGVGVGCVRVLLLLLDLGLDTFIRRN